MGNKVIKHYSEYGYASDIPMVPKTPPEPDKSKSISQLTRDELWAMLARLRDETEIQRVIRELKRNSGEKDTYEKPFKIDTDTPINQLYHAGVKGQKWGVRRFQNRDGTRTAAGKRRDLQKEQPDSKRHGTTKEKPKSEDHVKSRQAKAKGTDGLSNEELKKLNDRLQLESTYKKLTEEKIEKSDKWLTATLATSGKAAVADLSKSIMIGSAKMLIKQVSPTMYEAAYGKK